MPCLGHNVKGPVAGALTPTAGVGSVGGAKVKRWSGFYTLPSQRNTFSHLRGFAAGPRSAPKGGLRRVRHGGTRTPKPPQ